MPDDVFPPEDAALSGQSGVPATEESNFSPEQNSFPELVDTIPGMPADVFSHADSALSGQSAASAAEEREFSSEQNSLSEPADAVSSLEAAEPQHAPNDDRRDPGKEFASLPPAPQEPDLVSLRQLVFQRELLLLEQLDARLSDPGLHTKDISKVVVEALLLRSHKDDKLERVLEPLVRKIFGHSLRKNRFTLAQAMFPIMGPAIRRSIAETFRSMLESLNKSVEMSLSWKGLRWRIEAWRTGKPFSEVVLLHTLVYRVEQIFLIHSSTGLVLTHIVGEDVESQDADMISGMLTAIQDFVRDCFTGDNEGSLEQLQFGEFTILVEKTALAYIACVVRGTPPISFRQKLRSSLDLILVEHAETLADYNGDNEPFLTTHGLLDDCMESKFVEESKVLPVWIKALPVMLLMLIAAGAGMWLYTKYTTAQQMAAAELLAAQQMAAAELLVQQQRQKRETVVDSLRKEPGILVMNVHSEDNQPWEITCLRDELARPIPLVIEEAGGHIGNFTLTEIAYDSFEQEIVTLRVKRELHPPEGVQMEYAGNGILRFSGTAPLQWILYIKQSARTVSGIKEVVITDLTDPRLDTLLAMTHSVEAAVIEFPLGKDVPVPMDLPKLINTVNTLTAIEKLAEEMGVTVSLAVYGYADASGNDKRNFELSQARARTLAALLYARGSKLRISVYGMPTEYNQTFRKNTASELPERRLELRVHLTPQDLDVFELLEKNE